MRVTVRFAIYNLCRASYLIVSITVEYPARVSSVDWSASVGFTPAAPRTRGSGGSLKSGESTTLTTPARYVPIDMVVFHALVVCVGRVFPTKVVPRGFEPRSFGPKPNRIARYPMELTVSAQQHRVDTTVTSSPA